MATVTVPTETEWAFTSNSTSNVVWYAPEDFTYNTTGSVTITNASTWYIQPSTVEHTQFQAYDYSDSGTGTFFHTGHNLFIQQPEPETEEQKKVRLEREQKRKVAEKRASRLFKSIVGSKYYKLFQRREYHEVIGRSGTRYRLRPGSMIDVMDSPFGDRVTHKLCIVHSYGSDIPKMDTMIHQYLLITCGEKGEKELLEIGIKHAA